MEVYTVPSLNITSHTGVMIMRVIPGDQHTGGPDDGDVGIYFAGHSEPIFTLHELLVSHILEFLLRVDVASPEEVIHVNVTVSTGEEGMAKTRRLFNKVG